MRIVTFGNPILKGFGLSRFAPKTMGAAYRKLKLLPPALCPLPSSIIKFDTIPVSGSFALFNGGSDA